MLDRDMEAVTGSFFKSCAPVPAIPARAAMAANGNAIVNPLVVNWHRDDSDVVIVRRSAEIGRTSAILLNPDINVIPGI